MLSGFTEQSRRKPSDIEGQAKGRVSGSERVKRPRTRDERLVAQLDVPVRQIDEVLPEVVLRSSKGNLHEGPPLWPLRFPD